MTKPKIHHVLLVLVSLPALISCASPISKTLRQEAAPGVTFPMVLANPHAYHGDTVIWGGYIIRTVNNRQGSQIYILQTPLGSDDKPGPSEASEGRFIADTGKFLDPLVYRKGHKITVAGTVTGKKPVTNKKTETVYSYPVVQVKQFHLWHQSSGSNTYYGGPYWWYDPYSDGYWDYPQPYFGGEEGFEGEEGRGFRGGGREMDEGGGEQGEGFGGDRDRR